MESTYMLRGNAEFSLRIGGLRAKPSSQCVATPKLHDALDLKRK